MDEGSARALPIDPDVVDSLRRLGRRAGRDVFAEVTQLFLTTADAQLEDAGDLLARHDFLELARLAHGLKGSSSVIGGRGVARAADALEAAAQRAAETGVTEPIRPAMSRFLEELEHFRRAARTITAAGTD